MPRSRSRSDSSRREYAREGSANSHGRRSRSREDSYSDDEPRRSPKDYIKLTDADAAFILGKGGKTKQKIARVSGAGLELPARSLTLEITGSDEERRLAKKYVECVMAQRVGDVVLDDRDSRFENDCTIVLVPSDCAGFVTGKNGAFLRQVEQEYGTIMFFVHLKSDEGTRRDGEKLAIFGPKRGRRGAELKVMAAIESRLPGHLTEDMQEHISDSEDWGTDVRRLKMDEMSWALGKKGATRKKLARASNCIVEYVGSVVHMSGTKRERTLAGEYLKWIMDQLVGHVEVDTEIRDDVAVLHIPQDCVGYVTGLKRATLSRIEEEWGAFMLFMDRKEDTHRQKEKAKLAIFGTRKNRRGAELKVMSTVEGKCPKYFTTGIHEGEERGEWGTDIYRFRGEELSYALGKEGMTKRKLAKAADCILEYVGDYAFCSGTRSERGRGMRYLKWLLRQRSGPVRVEDLGLSKRMTDVAEVQIPKETIPEVMGPKGSGLRSIEEQTATFLFMAFDRGGAEVLVICGADATNRSSAEHAVRAVVNDVERGRRGGGGGGRGRDDDYARSWGRDRWDDGMAMTKYRRGDDGYGHRGGYGDSWDRGYDRDGYDRRDDRYDRDYGYGGYSDRRGYGRRSRSRSRDSYDSYDSYDRRDKRGGDRRDDYRRADDYRRDDYYRREDDYDRRDRDRGRYRY